jgi:UDP-2,3-diacylglucosamine hydrolase
LHLSPANARGAAAFHAFARGPARRAAAVYILGDLFDVWIGDDQLRVPFYRRVVESLREVSSAGVPVYVARGNRDFLIGEDFARAAGATLLPEHTVLDLAGVPTLLTHGDELCTDDVAYQRFRAHARTPQWRANILSKSYWQRRLIGWYLRMRSRRATAQKAESIMDVNDASVAEAFRMHHVTRMIHGHTHRPARHSLTVDSTPCERYVMAASHDGAHYLEVDEHGVQVRTIRGAML